MIGKLMKWEFIQFMAFFATFFSFVKQTNQTCGNSHSRPMRVSCFCFFIKNFLINRISYEGYY